MSKILKRPMFRRGGEVGGGIMSGIVTREKHAEQPMVGNLKNTMNFDPKVQADIEMATKGYEDVLTKLAPSKDEILSKLLITGGLRGLSQTGGGSTLANLAAAFEKPAAEALEESFSGKRMGAQAKLKGLEFGLGKKAAEDIQKIKSDAALARGYESGSYFGRKQNLMNLFAKETGFDPSNTLVLTEQYLGLENKGLSNAYRGVMQDQDGRPLTEEQIEARNPRVGSIFYDQNIKEMKVIDENGQLVILEDYLSRQKGD